jgi:hypothetical protein
MHEPFYKNGSYVNEQLGLYVGWTCHPGSYSDCMPVVNEKKDIVLIFCGEHFADRSMTQKLNGRGYPDGPKAGEFLQMYEG